MILSSQDITTLNIINEYRNENIHKSESQHIRPLDKRSFTNKEYQLFSSLNKSAMKPSEMASLSNSKP